MWIVTVLGGILSVPIQVALVGLLNGVKANFKVGLKLRVMISGLVTTYRARRYRNKVQVHNNAQNNETDIFIIQYFNKSKISFRP